MEGMTAVGKTKNFVLAPFFERKSNQLIDQLLQNKALCRSFLQESTRNDSSLWEQKQDAIELLGLIWPRSQMNFAPFGDSTWTHTSSPSIEVSDVPTGTVLTEYAVLRFSNDFQGEILCPNYRGRARHNRLTLLITTFSRCTAVSQ